MSLEVLPMLTILAGLTFYVVLAGADFGAAVWQVLAGRGPHAEEVREHAHESIAPVWEANHVWLIFVLTVMWTAYPTALGSLASTLYVAFFVAGIGIILRGAAYALRAGTSSRRQVLTIDAASAVASVITPFALGAAVGGIASGRVPVGNAAGDPWASWINPTSVMIGVLAVVSSAYIAAVFLAADAARRREAAVADAFRARALVAGLVAGALSLAGLVVLRGDARGLFDDLVGGAGLAGVAVSALAGAATLALVYTHRYETARYTAALAVAAIVASWAIAQSPTILPGLTIEEAAAPRDTLVAVLVAIAAGAVVLFPSLGLLFRLALGGRLGTAHGAGVAVTEAVAPDGSREPAGTAPALAGPRDLLLAARAGLLARSALACLVAGLGFLNVADAAWAHAVGVVALLAFVVLAFFAAIPALVAPDRLPRHG
jgi:cytochrome d ubiquinol oxidase subunit II